MTNPTYKQFVYDLATLWSQYEIEIYESWIDGPMGNPSPANLVDMSLFQWARFYWESDEKYAVRPHQRAWFRMSCRKGGSKYQLFTHKARIISLRVSELLNEYDRQEILFRRFPPVTDYKPVEIKKSRFILYPNVNTRYEGHKQYEEYKNRNPILFREYPPVTLTYAPEGLRYMKRMQGLMYPDSGGLMFGAYTPIESGEFRTPEYKEA